MLCTKVELALIAFTERPRVALTMRLTSAVDYDERRDSISHDWIRTLNAWQMTPVLIPNVHSDSRDYLDGIRPHAVILTGGDDLNAESVRDVTERAVLDHALRTGIPVFGVCRGMQLINTHFGGALTDIVGHVRTRHKVKTLDPWHEFYGPETEVNSYHTIGVAPGGLADVLDPTMVDESGYIEGLRHRSRPVVAVMWHPERDGGTPGDRLLISRLIEEGAFWK